MADNAIALQVINGSSETDNPEILIFQQNAATGFGEFAIAWQVIRNLGQGDRHPFEYALQAQVAASDSYGNYTPLFPISPGQAYQMALDASGDVLRLYPPGASDPAEMEVRNDLEKGSINALIYRSGKLAAQKTNIGPAQKAVFQFKPTIFIGIAKGVEEGAIIHSAVLPEINTEISLLGILSADIVLTGGGSGTVAKPYEFTLENVVFV